jgi:hypothetical protein
MEEIVRARYLRSSRVVSRVIADETLVVPIRGGVGDLDSIFSFNPLGSDLWTLLEKASSLEEMTSWITEHYDVTQERALADIQDFVDELMGAGLVTPVTHPLATPGEQ